VEVIRGKCAGGNANSRNISEFMLYERTSSTVLIEAFLRIVTTSEIVAALTH